MTFFDDVWQRTVTVVEQQRDQPKLFKPDGTPLVVDRSVGFKPPKASAPTASPDRK